MKIQNLSKYTKVPIDLRGNKMHAQFAPNGKELVFNYKVRDNNYNIYTISVNGKRLERIIANAFENTYPRFTPRGDAILYFSKKHTKNVNDEIYKILKKFIDFFKFDFTFNDIRREFNCLALV